MKKRILFIDDDPGVLMVGDMFLKSLGHEALLASSGEEAIDIIQNQKSKIDCIFLDLMMPGLSGTEVLTFMRDASIGIPVVVQTGIINESDLELVKRLGAVDYICKPYSKEDVKSAIRKMVSLT